MEKKFGVIVLGEETSKKFDIYLDAEMESKKLDKNRRTMKLFRKIIAIS